MNTYQVTIVVVPRERFSCTPRSFDGYFKNKYKKLGWRRKDPILRPLKDEFRRNKISYNT